MVRALNRKLLRDLLQMKEQVLTIALVVACGAAAFVAALSALASVEFSRQVYYQSAHFAQVFASLKRAPQALAAQVAAIPGINQVETRLVFDVTLDVPDYPVPATGRMISLPAAGPPALNQLRLRLGRLPAPGKTQEVVVNDQFATAHHLKPGAWVAALLNGRRQPLQIVGIGLSPEYVFAELGHGYASNEQYGIFWMNHEALAAAFDMTGAFNDVTATLAPDASEPQVLATLDRLLAPYGGLGSYGRSEQLSHRTVTDELRQLKVMASTIPAIFLGVASFLLNVVMGRIVMTQREQIAALKAMGYENREIGRHYMGFVALIVLFGGLLGALLGALLGWLLTLRYGQFFHFPRLYFVVPPWLPLGAWAISMAAASGGVLNALRRVIRLAPAEAMRPPAPPSYRRSLPERLGLGRLLSPRGRMISRNMASRPVRTLLTILGIAFAIPLIISALFFNDALKEWLVVQFATADQADALVSFTQPVPASARFDLTHLPGVRYAEGLRIVAVRLRAGHRAYRTSLTGLPPHARLRHLLNARLQPEPVPPEGVVLTERLGKKLGVRPGNFVTIEVLEGSRPVRDVRITGFTYDLIGLSAYMARPQVNRLLDEGDVITTAALAVDRQALPALYVRLKQMPKVATVGIKAIAVQYFWDTTASFILYFATVMTLFAAAIAVGVVYNNARIALQERGWELASLRILGFTRAEVSQVLLTELGLEIALAVPVGLWLGYWVVRGLAHIISTEQFEIPAVAYPATYAMAALAVVLVGLLSALAVRRRIDRLDLVAVLKARD
jgi:putative ABC transport system permease protein